MTKRRASVSVAAIGATLFILISPNSVQAGNGLNMIGNGIESISMGGADVAVSRDTAAVNTNPAGLIQISGGQVTLDTSMAFALDVGHQDQLGNDLHVENNPIKWGEFGYAQRLAGHPIAFGLGLFAQGGAGYVYRDVATPFGGQDEFSSLFRIAKLDMGAAWQVKPDLSVGASLAVFYADINQKVFPDTSFYNASVPQQSFYGYELDGGETITYGYKLGAMLKTTDWLTLGVTYTGKVDLDMDGGTYISDQTAAGLGKVMYGDVRVTGLNLPQELGLGAAVQATPVLLISTAVKWINWSSALKTSTLTATAPDKPGAPATQVSTSALNWRDQVVLAVGVAYQLTHNALIRAGYNYGRNPIPNNTLNPLLAAISQHTLTAGAGYRLNPRWQLDGGLEYTFKETVHYTNPSLPFGPNAQELNEVLACHFRVTYRI